MKITTRGKGIPKYTIKKGAMSVDFDSKGYWLRMDVPGSNGTLGREQYIIELDEFDVARIVAGALEDKKIVEICRRNGWLMSEVIIKKIRKYKVFHDHIKAHFKEEHPKWKVICKICGKDIDQIYEEMGKVRKTFLCSDCAHQYHNFEIPPAQGFIPDYVLINNEKWIMWHRSPSHKVKCSVCGKKTNRVWERKISKEAKK